MNKKSLLHRISTLSVAGLLSLSLTGCIVHISDGVDGAEVSSVFGSLQVSEGKRVGNVSTVNGGVELRDDVTAKHVDTVNGGIEAGKNVSVESAETVNGDIEAGSGFLSQGDVETVNGDVEIGVDSQIFGHIETVNGDIKLEDVLVEQSLFTVNGDIRLTGDTHIKGDIVFSKRSKSTKKFFDNPVLVITGEVKIDGQIILESPVDLQIEDASLLNKVQQKFSLR